MKKGILAIICACLLIPSASYADNLMRDYVAAPPNTLLSLLYYDHITSDDSDYANELFLLREVYYFNVGSYLANAQIIVPFGHVSTESNSSLEDSSSGIGDAILLGSFWFVNDAKTKTYLAYSPYFFLPTGDYDQKQAVNMGDNRWAFREEVNFTKGWEVTPDHNLFFEVTTGFDFYTDNDEYAGNKNLSKDPLFNLESHISYDLTKMLTLSFDYYGHWGGATAIDDVDQHNSANIQTLGSTLALNFAPGWQALIQYKRDVKTADDGPEAEVVQARIFYATDFGNLFH